MSIAPPKEDSIQIREVWNDNLEEEFALIREIVDQFNHVAMDTEFPGVVLRPVGNFKNISDYNYQTLKDNVDMLKLIQLGLTFSDENGNLPTCGTDKFCIWQFNFREFNVTEDIFASDSIELLRQCGIDFKKNSEMGIDVNRFGELLMSSGIVLNDGVNWVTFHSGYDFGYLLKLLTCRSLPDSQAGFFDLINMYFPMVYDIKHLMKFCNSLHGGLNKLAELLEVERIGVCHQAGSDSLLTSSTFKKLKDNFFSGSTEKYAGVLRNASRLLSGLKEERVEAAKVFKAGGFGDILTGQVVDKKHLIDDVRQALYASKICSYAQGMNLIREMSIEKGWDLKLGVLTRIWKGGCIIRAVFLDWIKKAYDRNPDLANLLVDPEFAKEIIERQSDQQFSLLFCKCNFNICYYKLVLC
uniref:poly(A)-specific ribonuclease n=2 Tax=Saliceae TaxID=238069 RepID=A0A4U5QK92_POPAL|nr:hypothetical protein D5086_0000077360 [Populus alba]